MYQGYAPATSQVEHECHLSNKTPSTVHLCGLAKAKTLSQKNLRSAVVHQKVLLSREPQQGWEKPTFPSDTAVLAKYCCKLQLVCYVPCCLERCCSTMSDL